MSKQLPRSVAALRWTARVLSAIVLLFWGFFLVAHLTGDAGSSSRPLVWQDYVILISLVFSIIGLTIAWRWELFGSTVALVGLMTCAFANWKVVIFPGTLIPLTAILFLAAFLLSRRVSLSERPSAAAPR